MIARLDRRRLLELTGGAAVVATLGERSAQAGASDVAVGPELGDREAVFDSFFGSGEPLASGLTGYDARDSPASYAVRFTDDHADLVEVDLTGFPDGGLNDEDVRVGESRFQPDDARPLRSFTGGALRYGGEEFQLATYGSESLADRTGRTGNVMVMEARPTPGDGPSPPWVYTHATVAMESDDVNEVRPGGSGATIGAPIDWWFDAYGEGGASQRARLVDRSPLDGTLLLGTVTRDDRLYVREVEAAAQTTIPIGEAIALAESFLPDDAELVQTFVSLPSPTRPETRRVQVWSLGELQRYAAVVMSINGDEGTGDVRRGLVSLDTD